MKGLKTTTKILPFLVLALIFKGALVTSHDAGLSVPDWPTSYGYNMFTFPFSQWIGGIMYEHGHRLVASFIGFYTLVLAIWIWIAEPRRYIKFTAALALFAVILQGALGGLTVLYGLPDAISVAHATLGQTFFLITITLAYFYSENWKHYETSGIRWSDFVESPLSKAGLAAIAVLYVQLLLGAIMRHSGAGLAVPDFPTVGGEWFPRFDAAMYEVINQMRAGYNLLPVKTWQVIWHLSHRVWAVVVLGVVGNYILCQKKIPENKTGKLPISMIALLILQIALGIWTVGSGRHPWVSSIHVMLGALLLGTTYFTWCNLSSTRDN